MKCQNCGKQDATFYFRANINGAVTKRHLCQECAEGMQGIFSTTLMGRSVLEDSLMGGVLDNDFMKSSLFDKENMLPGFTENLPKTEVSTPIPVLPGERHIPRDDILAERRKLNSLKSEIKASIKSENFEQAAKLRDEIHRLEGKNGEHNG